MEGGIASPMLSFLHLICANFMLFLILSCVNMSPDFYADQCIGYPDSRNMFLQYKNQYRKGHGMYVLHLMATLHIFVSLTFYRFLYF